MDIRSRLGVPTEGFLGARVDGNTVLANGFEYTQCIIGGFTQRRIAIDCADTKELQIVVICCK